MGRKRFRGRNAIDVRNLPHPRVTCAQALSVLGFRGTSCSLLRLSANHPCQRGFTGSTNRLATRLVTGWKSSRMRRPISGKPPITASNEMMVTLGYSDWATQDISATHREMWYRVSKHGRDFLLESSYAGQEWQQLRITHLHKAAAQVEAGVYACSPIGKDFWCRFKRLEISG